MHSFNKTLCLVAVPAFIAGTGVAAIFFATRLQPSDQQLWTIVGSVGTCAGAVAAAAGVLFAAFSFGATVQQSKLSLGADMVLKLDDRFKTPEMKNARARAAQKLATKALTSDENVDLVLDFFEQVALFERRSAIDTELVWHTFYHWFFNYYHLSKSYREYARQDDTSLWADIEQLYERIVMAQAGVRQSRTSCLTLCKRTKKTRGLVPTTGELERFVNEEIALIR